MADVNFVFLIGQVTHEPRFSQDENGVYDRAKIPIMTFSRDIRDFTGQYSPKAQYPYIEATDKEIVEQIVQLGLHENDIIEVKGTMASRHILRAFTCPCEECKHENVYSGVLDYISPIYVGKRTSACDSKVKGNKYLRNCAEISNIVNAMGKLVRNPVLQKTGDVNEAKYVLALRRHRFNPDEPELDTDYAFVKTFGDQALKDSTSIYESSLVYVNGYVATELREKSEVCEACNGPLTYKYMTQHIVPYNVEYVENCNVYDAGKAQELEALRASNELVEE